MQVLRTVSAELICGATVAAHDSMEAVQRKTCLHHHRARANVCACWQGHHGLRRTCWAGEVSCGRSVRGIFGKVVYLSCTSLNGGVDCKYAMRSVRFDGGCVQAFR